MSPERLYLDAIVDGAEDGVLKEGEWKIGLNPDPWVFGCAALATATSTGPAQS